MICVSLNYALLDLFSSGLVSAFFRHFVLVRACSRVCSRVCLLVLARVFARVFCSYRSPLVLARVFARVFCLFVLARVFARVFARIVRLSCLLACLHRMCRSAHGSFTACVAYRILVFIGFTHLYIRLCCIRIYRNI